MVAHRASRDVSRATHHRPGGPGAARWSQHPEHRDLRQRAVSRSKLVMRAVARSRPSSSVTATW